VHRGGVDRDRHQGEGHQGVPERQQEDLAAVVGVP
jgi:hypothetical protein